MQITVEFNPKSTAKNVKKAVTLSEKLNSQKLTGDERIISLTQDTCRITKEFLTVLDIVNKLAKTHIFIDGELIEDTHHVYGLLTCVKKTYCNGICSLETGGFHNLFKELGVIKSKDFFWGIQENDIESLNILAPEIFNLIRPDYVEINSERLIQAYTENSTNISKVCSVYSLDATVIELRKLPEIVKVNIKSIFGGNEDSNDDDLQNDFPSQNVSHDNSENQDEYIVKISPQQINDLAIKMADEMEIRLRKLFLEFK